MDQKLINDILIAYICFIPLITFHEFGHAWMAWKCGDDTAYLQGRVTLNPISHMEFIGTLVLPLLAMYLAATHSAMAGFVIGWGKPVPVNYGRLRHPRRDDTLVALAGPAMNIILAVVFMAGLKMTYLAGAASLAVDRIVLQTIWMSLCLCFFNLIPIPPLDGSHVLRNAIGMSITTYIRLCQYGFIFVIIAIQLPFVRQYIAWASSGTLHLIAAMFQMKF